MKTVGYAIAMLLVGLLLGTWNLKGDLRKAQDEVKRLQAEARKTQRRTSRADGIVTFLNIPEAAGAPGAPSGPSPVITNAPPAPFAQEGPRHPRRRGRFGDDDQPRDETMHERIERAKELWKVRSDLARDAFVSNVTSNREQVTQFDVIMAAMNLRLSNSIRTWVDFLKDEQVMTPETGVRMMNDMTEIMVLGYNDLDRTLPPDWRDNAGDNFQLIDFVDPNVATPLIEVDGIIRTQRWERSSASTNNPFAE